MRVAYTADQHLELWVKDTGILEGFTAYVGTLRVDEVSDGQTHAFPIARPESLLNLVVQFGGQSGGHTAIVDNQGPGQRKVLARQEGLSHAYEIVSA
jgi:hypothetical protein